MIKYVLVVTKIMLFLWYFFSALRSMIKGFSMEIMTKSEIDYVSGAGADSYMMAVNLEIAQIMAAQFNQCNVSDLTNDMFKSAIASGLLGSMSGAVAVPGIGMVPGWIAGATTGAATAAFTYGLTCWW
ncbi:hypothetical protein EHW64_19510 [Erwinia psidii]|uniref:hypothetical protein n=1 Tax=Erwinia psidii TaxID=69224 RepID=UPI00226BA6B2|nr:hypothetical protein [Erwinia psidii]MCX8958331.1 hypothetical protein [Erwinia psidii]MCX8963239.1 hypothetical protein [Erwinia psidii]